LLTVIAFSDTSYVPIASSDSSFDLLNYSESELSFDLDEDDSVMASRGAVLGKRGKFLSYHLAAPHIITQPFRYI
jgi:hypothetical protein